MPPMNNPTVVTLPAIPPFDAQVVGDYSASTAVGLITALRAYLTPLRPLGRVVTVAAIRGALTVQNGNYDVGIYSTADWVTFTRRYSLGTTAVPAGAAEVTWASPALALTVGLQYFTAFIVDGVPTVGRSQANASNPWNGYYYADQATALLPASIVSPTAGGNAVQPSLVCTLTGGDPAA